MDSFNKTRLVSSVALGVLLLSAQVAGYLYVDRNLSSDYVPYDINNNQVVGSYFDNTVYMVKDDKGYYGIVSANGSELISTEWNTIEVLSKDRFVVGRVLNSASVSMGVLDDYENVVVPMVFKSISRENDYFTVGTLNQSGKKVLFDHLGNVQLYQEWDSYEVDGDTAKVKKGDDTAVVVADEDGECSYSSLYIPSSILGKDFSVTVKDPVSDGTSAFDDYLNVVDDLSVYCEALFNSDTDAVRSVTSSQYYNSLISNMLPNCKLNHVSNVSVYGERDDSLNGAVLYHADIKLAYTSSSVVVDDTSTSQEMDTVQVRMEFVRSQDGSIVLRSAEKTLDGDEDALPNATVEASESEAVVSDGEPWE